VLYADNLTVVDKKAQGYRHVSLIGRGNWRAMTLRLTSKRQKPCLVCAKTNETLMIRDRTGHLLEQTEIFKYLGSVMNAKGMLSRTGSGELGKSGKT